MRSGMGENRGVMPAQPGMSSSPSDCRIGMFESEKQKKNGYPKVSVLVRQKGLEPLTY